MLFKILHFWDQSKGDVLIPFVCANCGKCCKKLGTGWTLSDIQRAAEYLDLEPLLFLERYLESDENSGEDRISYKKKISPCPLLTEDARCSIYPVRPIACRLYPLKTRNKSGEVDCPGEEKMGKIIEEMGQRSEFVITNHYLPSGEKRDYKWLRSLVWNIPNEENWEKIKKKFLETSPSEKARRLFLDLNKKLRVEK